jgi:hypothetical protein
VTALDRGELPCPDAHTVTVLSESPPTLTATVLKATGELVSYLRRVSTRRLLLLCGAVVAVVAAGTAIAIAAGSRGPTPQPKPLAQALRDAVAAPPVQGVTARITFTNKLVDSASLQGSDPILTGAAGRLWASRDRLRLELQASPDRGGSDVQVQVAGDAVSIYDSGSNTVYRGTLPRDGGKNAATPDTVPSLARIQRLLGRLSQHAVISGARPSNVAGRPAYTVRVSPRNDGGLLGSVQLAWDAANGVPLRAGVYAAGAADPVLELEATDVAFGPVAGSSLRVPVPSGARTVSLDPSGARGTGTPGTPIVGTAAVQGRVSFRLAAPRTLVGLPRKAVRLIEEDRTPGALVTYGKGLGGIAVLETPASNQQGRMGAAGGQLTLPKISINGASGEELDTALGTVVRFERAGVSYTVIGSVPPAAAEAAARAL